MKVKPLLGIALVAAVIGGFWLWRERAEHKPAAENRIPAAPVPALAADAGGKNPTLAAITNAPRLSAPVEALLDTHRNLAERAVAVDELSTNLTEADWLAIRDYLLTKDPADELPLGQALKNRLLDALCALMPPPSALGDTLARMYRDSKQDEVIRDYAVQHLVAYYEQLEIVHQDEPEAKRQIRELLWEALHETGNSIAGTALLGLKRLSDGREEFDRREISDAALRMANDAGTGELARITAFQVCGQLGLSDVGPVLLQTALNGDSIPLRISAIGALGVLGDSQATPLLTEILNGDESRLKLPARRALMRIQKAEEQKQSLNKPKI
jgi:hypothetical protein